MVMPNLVRHLLDYFSRDVRQEVLKQVQDDEETLPCLRYKCHFRFCGCNR